MPWGLWVVFYLYFVGLTAGAFLITILTYVFQVKRFERIGRLSAFTVLVALLCELIFIWFDLGHMSRIYRFLHHTQLHIAHDLVLRVHQC